MALKELRAKLPSNLPGWTVNSFIFGGHEGAIEWAEERRGQSPLDPSAALRFRMALGAAANSPLPLLAADTHLALPGGPMPSPPWQGNYRVRLYDDGALVELISRGEVVAAMRT